MTVKHNNKGFDWLSQFEELSDIEASQVKGGSTAKDQLSELSKESTQFQEESTQIQTESQFTIKALQAIQSGIKQVKA